MAAVYLDTNIFLYLTNKRSLFYQSCWQFLQYCKENNLFIVTSAETIQEIIHYSQNLKKLGKGLEAAKQVFKVISQLLVVDRNVIDLYLELIKKYSRVASRDILHLAASLENSVDFIITYDRDFKKFRQITSLTPDEFLKRY